MSVGHMKWGGKAWRRSVIVGHGTGGRLTGLTQHGLGPSGRSPHGLKVTIVLVCLVFAGFASKSTDWPSRTAQPLSGDDGIPEYLTVHCMAIKIANVESGFVSRWRQQHFPQIRPPSRQEFLQSLPRDPRVRRAFARSTSLFAVRRNQVHPIDLGDI